MSATLALNQLGNLSIAFLDNSNPPVAIVPTPTPDAAPVWTVSDTTVATLVADPTGLTAVLTPVAVGPVTVTLALTVGGVSFNATASITVAASSTGAPGPLTSIAIVLTPVAKP